MRALKAASPFLTEADIVKLTGFDRTQVKNAMARKVKVRIKSVAEGSNPERNVG